MEDNAELRMLIFSQEIEAGKRLGLGIAYLLCRRQRINLDFARKIKQGGGVFITIAHHVNAERRKKPRNTGFLSKNRVELGKQQQEQPPIPLPPPASTAWVQPDQAPLPAVMIWSVKSEDEPGNN
ncbi:hypothetical protein P7K49_021148 [Saguinus oedipus]|uniref:Uncharacterized protein n=1 Tax=Saguinus oedipus TaxID=9490 RepID=A0ABQ9URU5_SAGOE|nr:hypothetical protein P7K49_021148 [Saguinus oedipus]